MCVRDMDVYWVWECMGCVLGVGVHIWGVGVYGVWECIKLESEKGVGAYGACE